MNSKLTLTHPLLATNGHPTDAIAVALAQSTAQLEGNIKLNISSTRKTGRTYRRTPLVRKASRRNSGLKLQKAAGSEKLIVGYTFHRASARGESPAIDTGRLINSIRGTKVSKFRYRINVGVDYGLPLDDPEGLDRPFFHSEIEKYRPVFFENIRRAALGK